MNRVYISTDLKLDKLVRALIQIDVKAHDRFVFELYKHIEHTRRIAYHNGYQQGRFDAIADAEMKHVEERDNNE